MQPRRLRWNCACLHRNWRCSPRSYLTWESSADSKPRAGPNRYGPDMDRIYPTLWDPVGSYRGWCTAGWIQRWPFTFKMLSPTYPGPERQLPGTEVKPGKTGNDRFIFGIPNPTYPGLDKWRQGTGTQPVKPASDRFAFGIATPTYLRSDRQLPGSETQPGLDRFRDSLPDMTGSGAHDDLPDRKKGYDPTRSPEVVLMDTMAHLQLEVEVLKFGQLEQSTLARRISPVRSNRWCLPKCPSLLGWLVGNNIDKCLTQLYGRMVGWRYGCSAAVVSPGGRCVERGPVGSRGEASHADRIGRGTLYGSLAGWQTIAASSRGRPRWKGRTRRFSP